MRSHSRLPLCPARGPAPKKCGDRLILSVLIIYLCWAPLEAHITRATTLTRYLCLGVAGATLLAFMAYLMANRSGFGVAGSGLRWAVLALLAADGASYLVNGGLHGPHELVRFYPSRLVLVVLTGLVAYRLARLKVLTIRAITLLSVMMSGGLMLSMLVAKLTGVQLAHSYRGVAQAGGIGGTHLPGYLMAFSLPGLAALRRVLLKYSIMGLILVAIMLTYGRGALACAALAVALAILFDYQQGHRLRPRLLGVAIVSTCIAVPVMTVGVEQLVPRWRGLYDLEATAMSMRDRIYPALARGILHDIDCLPFGHGIGTTVVATERFAHNDWLEIAYSSGLAGALSFVFLHLVLLKATLLLLRLHNKSSVFAVTAYALFFVANITTSVMHATQYGALLFCLLGALCAWADNAQGTVRHTMAISKGSGSL